MEQKKFTSPIQEEGTVPPEKITRNAPIKYRLSLDNFLISHNFLHPYKVKLVLLLILLVIVSLSVLSFSNLTTDSQTTTLGFDNIGELATQSCSYTNVQVIEKDRELWGVHIPLTQSKSIFSYDGIIRAGYDFAEIDIDVDEISHTVTVAFPEAKILSNTIDYESLRIYDESESIFTPIKIEDSNQSFIDLAQESEQTAIENGILENARTNAEYLITAMLANTIDLQVFEVVFS